MQKFMKDQLSPPKFDGVYRVLVHGRCYEYHTKAQAKGQFKQWKKSPSTTRAKLYSWIFDSGKWLLIAEYECDEQQPRLIKEEN